MGHGLKAGDLVVRTVAYNRHPRAAPFKTQTVRVLRVTKAGYVYLSRSFGKFHGDDFPLREWSRRGEHQQYIIQIEGIAPSPQANADE